jgi:hypothetical protein
LRTRSIPDLHVSFVERRQKAGRTINAEAFDRRIERGFTFSASTLNALTTCSVPSRAPPEWPSRCVVVSFRAGGRRVVGAESETLHVPPEEQRVSAAARHGSRREAFKRL